VILLWKYHRSPKFWDDLFMRAICYFTRSEYVHAEVFVNGCTYGMHDTIKRWPHQRPSDEVWAMDLTPEQETAIYEYCERAYQDQIRYNIPKVVALAVVYPTRWIWRKLGWVPFDAYVHGAVCSELVDEAYKAAGIDLLPNDHEGYTAPVDFTRSPLLQRLT